MFTCIGPADLSYRGVIRESVGQTDAVRHHHPAVLTIHRRTLDLRSFSVPVCPIQSAAGRKTGVRHNSTHIIQAPFASGGTTKPIFAFLHGCFLANIMRQEETCTSIKCSCTSGYMKVRERRPPGSSCLMLMRSRSGYSEQRVTFDLQLRLGRSHRKIWTT